MYSTGWWRGRWLPVGLVVADDAADVLAVEHVLVTLVDVFETVRAGDHLVDLEQTRLVEADQARRLDMAATAAEDVAFQRLLQHREQEQVELDVDVGHGAHPRHHAGAGLGGQRHRLFDVLAAHVTHRDDRLLGHEALGEADDGFDRGSHRLVSVGGAELERLVAFELDRVDGDHVPGAGDHRALQRAHADAADSDDDDRLAGLNLGDVGGRAEAGGQRTAHDGGRLERHAVVDLDHGVLVHGQMGSERAEQVHRRHLPAAGIHPTGAVRDRLPAEQHSAAVAQRPEALQARLAVAAAGDERKDDVVALLDVCDTVADLGHDARALVAAEGREGDRGVSVHQVIVRVAHARGVQPDLYFIRDRVADLDLVDPER